MSQALYRQYRPQRFEDVVGQDVAVRTLRNAIERDRVAHAYLFTGTKGTGKTTLAKLLAKAMNCENGGPTTDPCGVCESCVAIAEGRSMDVAEIDAASNTGIDTVREKIIDTVAYQPARGARRVYIIDEAHQLSKAAFNALLKTIEEPPAHVLFVFCTTETHMMMATVRDRCQRIAMRSPGPDVLAEVLATVCEREGIAADEPTRRAIARAAQGSFRNALGTLEMLATTFGPSFSRDDVLQHLGVVSEETLFEMADAVIDGDAAGVLRLVDTLVQDGVDLDQFVRSLAEHVRGVLLQLHGVGEAAGVADTARLAVQAERADERRLLAVIDCVADAATRIRVGSDARISVETALVRACQGLGLPLLALRLAALEQKIEGGYGLPITAGGPSTAPARASRPEPVERSAPAAPAASERAAAPTPDSAAAATVRESAPAAGTAQAAEPLSDEQLRDVDAWWARVAAQVARTAAFRPALESMRPVRVDSERLVLQPGTKVLVSAGLKEALTGAVSTVTGRSLRVEVVPPDAPTRSDSSGPAVPAPGRAPTPAPAPAPASPPSVAATGGNVASADPGMANLISMFDATPVVREREGDDAGR